MVWQHGRDQEDGEDLGSSPKHAGHRPAQEVEDDRRVRAAEYIASLIAAANDGAKSAQTGALAFTLVGLYLLATAFSTTDEDLLLEHTMPVSQIGVQVPVIFSFAIAPAVFLFIHAYTLIRYDMLAVNLRQFRTDLQVTVPREPDRERCRQLLANVEFMQVRTAPTSSDLHSWLYRFVAWLVLAGFPVATLIVVQISSLRYQSNTVTVPQQVCIAVDLMLLIWFFFRQRRRGELSRGGSRPRWVRYSVPPLLKLVVLVADLLYLNVPGANEKNVFSHEPSWTKAYEQPLDLALCPALHWGCRYLTVDHRTLVGHVWSPQAIADLRAEQGDLKKSLAAIEGIFLRYRTLRFARFDESRIYAAEMIDADIRQATFVEAQLQGARLQSANLLGADLSEANLSGANLSEAYPLRADLSGAVLIGTTFSSANLSEVKQITQVQLDQACGNSDTKLPPSLTISVCPIIGNAQSAPSCQLPTDAKGISELKDNPTLAVSPAWSGSAAGMIPSGQPIMLHISFPADLPSPTASQPAPTFTVVGKLGATWQRYQLSPWQNYQLLSWQPASDNKRAGDLTLEQVPRSGPGQVLPSRIELVVAACTGGTLQVGRTNALVSPHVLSPR